MAKSPVQRAAIDFTKVTGISSASPYSLSPYKLIEARNAWPVEGPGGPIGRRPLLRAADKMVGSTFNHASAILKNARGFWDPIRGQGVALVTHRGGGAGTAVKVYDYSAGSPVYDVPFHPSDRSQLWFESANGWGFMLEWQGKVFFFPGPNSPKSFTYGVSPVVTTRLAAAPFYWFAGESDAVASRRAAVDDGTPADGSGTPYWFYHLGYPWEKDWDPTLARVSSTDGLVSDAGLWNPESLALRPRWATIYRDRMVLAGMDPPYHNSIVFCDVTDDGYMHPKLPSGVVNEYEIGPDGSQDWVIAVLRQSMFGGAEVIDAPLLIWKQKSFWVATGNPSIDGDAATDTMMFAKSAQGAGTESPRTIAETPHGVIWANEQNVWLWAGGPAPIPIGNDIRGYLEGAYGGRAQWHAQYVVDRHGGRYCLSLTYPYDTYNRFGHTSTNSYQEGQCQIQLWLDLRGGLDPKDPHWWGPMEIPSVAMTYVRAVEAQPETLVLWTYKPTGGSWTYRVTKFSMEDDGVGWDDAALNGITAVTAPTADEPGCVTVSLKTGYWTAGALNIRKVVNSAGICYGTGSGVERRATFTVNLIGNGGQKTTTDTVIAPVASSDPLSEDYRGQLADGTAGQMADNVLTVLGTAAPAEVITSTAVYPKITAEDGNPSRLVATAIGIEFTQLSDGFANYSKDEDIPGDGPVVAVTPGDTVSAGGANIWPTAKAVEFHYAELVYSVLPRRQE